jgi:hypothetical protein
MVADDHLEAFAQDLLKRSLAAPAANDSAERSCPSRSERGLSQAKSEGSPDQYGDALAGFR